MKAGRSSPLEGRALGTALALCAGVGWLSGALVLLDWLEPREAWPRGLVCLAALIFAPLYLTFLAERLRRFGCTLMWLVWALELAPLAFMPVPWAVALPACLAIVLQGHFLVASQHDPRAIACALLAPMHVSLALEATTSPLLLGLLPVSIFTSVSALVLVHRRFARSRVQRPRPEAAERGMRLGTSYSLALGTCLVGLALFLALVNPPWRWFADGRASTGSQDPANASAQATPSERSGGGSGAGGARSSYSTDLRFASGGAFPFGKGVVMRVRPLEGDAGPKLLMRMLVLDGFDEAGARLQRPRVPGRLRDEDDGDTDGWTIVSALPAPERLLRLGVHTQPRTLELGGEVWTVLFAPHPAVAVDVPEVRYDADSVFVATGAAQEDFRYQLLIERLDDSPANLQLRAARHPEPRFTALPTGPAVAAIAARARRVARSATTDFQRVTQIMAFLLRDFDYALEDLDFRGPETIARFLEVRRGYCTYFASAATMMLRSLGVSARVAAGFSAHEWSEAQDAFLVRERDLHAWVEVYFDGVGWVSYDPTPPSRRERAFGVLDGEIEPGAAPWLERLSNGIADWVDSGEGAELGKVLALVLEAPWAAARRYPWVAAALTLAAGAAVLRRARRRAADTPRTTARRAPSTPYARLMRALARHGWRRAPAQTPREFARSVVAAGGPELAPLAGIVEAFYRAHFGGRALSAADERSVEDLVRTLLAPAPDAAAPGPDGDGSLRRAPSHADR